MIRNVDKWCLEQAKRLIVIRKMDPKHVFIFGKLQLNMTDKIQFARYADDALLVLLCFKNLADLQSAIILLESIHSFSIRPECNPEN